jgi:hypothetical protein
MRGTPSLPSSPPSSPSPPRPPTLPLPSPEPTGPGTTPPSPVSSHKVVSTDLLPFFDFHALRSRSLSCPSSDPSQGLPLQSPRWTAPIENNCVVGMWILCLPITLALVCKVKNYAKTRSDSRDHTLLYGTSRSLAHYVGLVQCTRILCEHHLMRVPSSASLIS